MDQNILLKKLGDLQDLGDLQRGVDIQITITKICTSIQTNAEENQDSQSPHFAWQTNKTPLLY